MKIVLILSLTAAASLLRAAPQTSDKPKLPPQLQGITIDQHLNAQLPLDAEFQDESGQTVALRSFFTGKPVLLALVYYECPMLCNRILSGVVSGLRPLSLQAGRDFQVVAISFNPSETPAEAAAKRDLYSREYSRKSGNSGWHFLVGSPASIKAVTEAVGFHYRWDPKTKMYIHASGIMMATPEGKLARYFYGVEYQPKDLKLGLIESSHNTIGSPVDQILLFCYHYDPSTGKYGAVVVNLLRAAAVLILIVMGTGLLYLWRREPRHDQVAP
jgi:protein SCO1/2